MSLACFAVSFWLLRDSLFWEPDYRDYSDELRSSYSAKLAKENGIDLAAAKGMTNLYVNDLKANEQQNYARP